MNQRRSQIRGRQPIAGYVTRNGGLVPIIDLDAKVEIDLTGTDDEDEVLFTGMRWSTGVDVQQPGVSGGGATRRRGQVVQQGAGGIRSTSNTGASAQGNSSSRASITPFARSFVCVFFCIILVNY